jgi:NADH-quinone oxidoreductase subunit G
VTLWKHGKDEVYRVTGRKDQWGEVEEFICDDCRFHKKDVKDWVIEGPRNIKKSSVISQNHYVVKEPAHRINLNSVELVSKNVLTEGKE